MYRTIIEALKTWQGSFPRKPLVLRGARQVGKTYILKYFGEQYFPNYHYLNFEDDPQLNLLFQSTLAPKHILNEIQFYLDAAIDKDRNLLIFDEIQNCPRALTALKYFHEEMPELAICAAGSLLGITLTSDSFPVGNVTFQDLYPLNFVEFLLAIDQPSLVNLLDTTDFTKPLPQMAHEKLWHYWKRYLIVGGLPEAVNTYRQDMGNEYLTFKSVRKVQQDLLDTYSMDIAKHSGKTNAINIERLWHNVSAQLARSQNGSAPKFRFKNALPGISGYERLVTPLTWLEKAHLILRTSIVSRPGIPLSGYTRENYFKQYFFDVGLLGATSRLKPHAILSYDYGTYKGYFAENFIAQELNSAGVRPLYCWKGRTSEVEFLLETGSNIIPVEVKSGWVTQSKSLKVYEERYHPQQSIVLSAKNIHKTGMRLNAPLYCVYPLVRTITATV